MLALMLPSLATLESGDDVQLTVELRLARLRAQVAVVRTLADHVEHFARAANADGLSEQLTEEMARLGVRFFEAAGTIVRSPRPPDGGIFARSASFESDGSGLDSVAR